ncbi:uncharacterized protein TrAtP1_005495 [Trichoderma atroviride]|uniref:uncharacterized protein n=1 Tax=Hypocrea atroviridis TaxID=63577 RepID=UPI003317A539|nr:hypothetical protein TrAtP1_005495 [Trichoderma atroviride]
MIRAPLPCHVRLAGRVTGRFWSRPGSDWTLFSVCYIYYRAGLPEVQRQYRIVPRFAAFGPASRQAFAKRLKGNCGEKQETRLQ